MTDFEREDEMLRRREMIKMKNEKIAMQAERFKIAQKEEQKKDSAPKKSLIISPTVTGKRKKSESSRSNSNKQARKNRMIETVEVEDDKSQSSGRKRN